MSDAGHEHAHGHQHAIGHGCAHTSFAGIPIVGAASISVAGTGWRGLGEAALVIAAGTHVALPGLPAEAPLANPKTRKMMSRGAYLAARCLADLLADVSWKRGAVGYFLGVGASGGSLDDVTALLAASIADGRFSQERFGDAGLAACNPLLAFQLMNNFTLCHGAILEGIGGPNSALFSRGAGTTAALIEAMWAIRDGDCEHAIAGGADSPVHPVTRAELAREGFTERGMRVAEGAALLALGTGTTGARVLGVIEGAAIARSQSVASLDQCLAQITADAERWAKRKRETSTRVADVAPVPALPDLVVLAPWGPPASDLLGAWARRRYPVASVVDMTPVVGDSLAAAQALAWVAAIDILVMGEATRALVIGAGVDGDVGIVQIARGDA